MLSIENQFETYIENHSLIGDKDRVLAAVSGGADSMCMLLLLYDYFSRKEQTVDRLGAVCVNHGFRKEAADEAAYVETVCRKLHIPFFLKEIPPGECQKAEEAAREFRYRLITETADKYGYNRIALAHNAQDKAETVLFNLFRGTGIRGLAGIRSSRDSYIRPVLWMNRTQIEDYLKKRSIRWCTDSSNLTDEFSRNRIRHNILPESEKINAQAVRHICEAGEQLAEIEEFISGQAQEYIFANMSHTNGESKLTVDELKKNRPVLRREIYRQIIAQMTPHLKDITAGHIRSIDELVTRQGNASVDLPYCIRVLRSYGELIFIQTAKNHQTSEEYAFRSRIIDRSTIKGEFPECVPRNKYTKWFDYDKIDGSFYLRTRREEDTLVIDRAGHRKSVSRYMIEEKIPAYIRDRVPLLATDTDILWIVGYRDSCAYRIDSTTTQILEIEIITED